jgi:trimeric autotransporter adhesin
MKKLLSCLIFSLSISVFSFSQSNTFAGAALVPTTSTCVTGTNQLAHTLNSSTNEAGTTITGNSCGSSNTTADVWYRFTTQTEFPVITVTPTGSSWMTTVPIRVQILEGTALNPLTQRGCGNSANSGIIIGTPVTVTPSTALTPGTTYYVRISKGTAGNPTGTNWGYTICIKEGTASRMGEVFKQTILSAANPEPVSAALLRYPWEIAYGPDNNLWVTEARGYKLNKIDPNTGTRTTVLDLSSGSTWLTTNGAPAGSDTLAAITTNIWNGGWPSGTATNPNWPQGGFAGMALHPQFLDGSGTKDYVYITYVHRYLSGGGTSTGVRFRNKLVRFTYNAGTQKFSMPVVLCDTLPGSNDHNSQRLTIAPVGGTNYLFLAQGDMGAGQFGNRDRTMKAHLVNSYEGKILRFNLESDGDAGGNAWIPNDNPFGASSAVYVTGIRNNQGFAYDPATGLLYGASHGPYSDDEINIIEAGKNYGHPFVIGYSSDGNYNGTTTQPLNTTITAGAPFSDNNGISTCPPIGNEATNATTIGAATYRDPIFSAYASSSATILTNWRNTPNVPNAGWESEAWSGLDLYTNTVIPGWKKSLIASGLKWGRMIRLKLGAAGTTTLPSNLSQNNTGDTVTYFQSGNRYRDLAYGSNGKDIYLVMDNSSATSGPGVGNPTVPACPGCVIKYTFLGYVKDGSSAIGVSTIPKSIDVTSGTLNNCNTGNTVVIDATNNNLWVPITGPDGNILAEINASGNNLGTVTSSFYQNSGAIRNKGGVRYLDRNITITPAVNGPYGTPVKLRLYISKAEFDALDADVASGLTGTGNIGLLRILKNNDPCRATASAATTMITPTNTVLTDLQHGANGYVLQADISSFSSFYFGTSNVTLPLDLLTFTGSLQNNATTLLKWQTENEVNTSYFEIERSSDGNNFNNIGTVSAAGNNTSVLDYSFTDNDVANQPSLVVYYRLKMVDINGAFKYSNVITITLADITGRVTVVPNPVNNEARITVAAPEDGRLNYKIIDNAGRTIIQKTLQVRKGVVNTIFVDMSRLSTGMYYLNVTGAGINSNTKLQKL